MFFVRKFAPNVSDAALAFIDSALAAPRLQWAPANLAHGNANAPFLGRIAALALTRIREDARRAQLRQPPLLLKPGTGGAALPLPSPPEVGERVVGLFDLRVLVRRHLAPLPAEEPARTMRVKMRTDTVSAPP